MTDLITDEPTSELYDPNIPRVDLVGKAANGTAFLFAKSAADPAMFDADTVRALIKEQENAPMETTTVDPVAKADTVDIAQPLAEPEQKAPGGAGENDPGSPAWESVDHATAEKWLAILYRAQNALGVLATREDLELVSGATAASHGDGMAAWNLEDAASAIGYAIGLLAIYSANEKAEVELSAELEQVGKALADDTTALEVLERLAPVLKAGRVLSAANEAALRGAAESINKVLAALPAAPDTVEKETIVEPTITPAATAAPESEVTKADALRIVYDKDGGVVGVVKPSAIQPVEGGGKPDTDPADPEEDAEPAEPGADDLDPAPAATVGDPADALAKAEEAKPVEKGIEPETVEKSTEDLRKELLEKDEQHAAVVKQLEAQIEVLKAEPAPSKVLANGVLPQADHMRGQDDGAKRVDVRKAEDLRKQLADAATPAEQEVIKGQLNELAIAALQGVHSGQ